MPFTLQRASESQDFIDFFLESECAEEDQLQLSDQLVHSPMRALKVERKMMTEGEKEVRCHDGLPQRSWAS